MSRKTIKVSEILNTVNKLCQTSHGPSAEWRQGMLYLLENVLHKTHNYKGFVYLTVEQVPAGELPGINYIKVNGTMVPHPDHNKRFENTDSTRVRYL